MLRYGKICEVDYTKGFARVNFDEIDLVSFWLSLPTVSVKGIKHFIPLSINTQVAVLMHPDGEQGEILKAVWSSEDAPPAWANKDTQGMEFSDGTKIYYDQSTHKLTISIASNGTIEINGGNLGGLVKAGVLKTESEKDKDILDTFLQALQTPVNEPGNGAPSAFQAALLAALGSKQSGTWTSLENNKIKQ